MHEKSSFENEGNADSGETIDTTNYFLTIQRFIKNRLPCESQYTLAGVSFSHYHSIFGLSHKNDSF